MPLWKCNECHHEWEGSSHKCDWCGNFGFKLVEETGLERLIKWVLGRKEPIIRLVKRGPKPPA